MDIALSVDSVPLERRLAAIRARLTNFAPLFRSAVDDWVTGMEKAQFASQGGLSPQPWQQLSPKYLIRKQSQGVASLGILRYSDRLFRSVTNRTHPDKQVVLTNTQGTWITKVPYATYHQSGTGKMPQRQVFPDPIPAPYLTRLREIVKQYALTGAGGAR